MLARNLYGFVMLCFKKINYFTFANKNFSPDRLIFTKKKNKIKVFVPKKKFFFKFNQ